MTNHWKHETIQPAGKRYFNCPTAGIYYQFLTHSLDNIAIPQIAVTHSGKIFNYLFILFKTEQRNGEDLVREQNEMQRGVVETAAHLIRIEKPLPYPHLLKEKV